MYILYHEGHPDNWWTYKTAKEAGEALTKLIAEVNKNLIDDPSPETIGIYDTSKWGFRYLTLARYDFDLGRVMWDYPDPYRIKVASKTCREIQANNG